MNKAVFAYLWIALLPGCMTMDMLKTAGKGYMDGEYGMATTALAFAPLMLVPDAVDVVTLGAASRPRERSAEPVESSGQTSAMLGSLLQVAGQATQASGLGQGYESGVLMAGVGAALVGDNTAASASTSYATQSPNSALPDNRSVLHCVKFGVSQSGHHEVRNTCNFDINVAWCPPRNTAPGICGGILQLSGYGVERVLAPIKQNSVYGACRWPLHVSSPSGGGWTGNGGSYSCRPI